MSEYVKAWQCIGCGKIESAQTCIGVCQDRRVEFVYASEHENALSRLRLARCEADTFGALVRRLAWTRPRDGEWEHSYRALQQEARIALMGLGADSTGDDGTDKPSNKRVHGNIQ